MTPSFQHNTYPHQTYNLNTRKKQQLQELANEITKGCRELQPHVEEHLIKTGQPLPKYPELPKGTTTRTRLTARQLKTVGNIVHDNLASYLTTLETEVRSLISNSSLAGKNPSTGKKSKGDETLPNQLAPFDLTTLYRVNKRHAWWAKPGFTLLWKPDAKTGELTPCDRKTKNAIELEVPEWILKLSRMLVKQARKLRGLPSYREGCGLRLDGIIASVHEVEDSTSPEIGYWVKVSTLKRGHPIWVPIKRNSYYEDQVRVKRSKGYAERAGAVQLVFRDGEPEFGLILKSDPALPVQGDGVVGVDWGITDALLATNMGDLFGQAFLRKIKELDDRLTVHDANLRSCGRSVKDDATHKRLERRIREFTVNEVGRVLNRILAQPDAHGELVATIVSEDLDFRHGGLSARGNRIVQRAGRAVLRRRLGELGVARGVESVLVDPAYTSRECSACGAVDAASRVSRSCYSCTSCGLKLHADVNAARVILARGVHGFGSGGYSAWLERNGESVLGGSFGSPGVRSRGLAGPRALTVQSS